MAEPVLPELPAWTDASGPRLLVLSSSPRTDGNSHALGDALVDGARAAGHDAVMVNLNDHVTADAA